MEIINDSNCQLEQRTQEDTKKTIVQLTQREPLDKLGVSLYGSK